MGVIGVSKQMQEILKEVENDVNTAIDNSLKTTGKQAKARLKEVSPKDHGDYSEGWTYTRTDKKGITVHNSKYPGLTHLLNNGHVIVNQYGRQPGRVNGDNHIKNVETEFNERFEEEIMKELNKG